ncbi:MAG TPA: hypothetical protein PK257_01670 [Candidatus Woesebacteria bacterium]|nr:hypothetical protein [Candidatus Woesebacteria bacterium]
MKDLNLKKIEKPESCEIEYQTNIPYLHFIDSYGSLIALVSKDFGKDVSSKSRGINIEIDPEQEKISKEMKTNFRNGIVELSNSLKHLTDKIKE